MIVETNSLTTIGVGAQKTQTEPGDATLKIPNLLLPVLELVEPATIFPDTTAQQQTSFVRSLFVSRNNQVSALFTIIFLSKGLWQLSFDYNIKMSFAAAIAFNTTGDLIRIISPVGGVSQTLLCHLPQATAGYFSKQHTVKLLLRDAAEIQLAVSDTGAADFMDTHVNMVGIKLL